MASQIMEWFGPRPSLAILRVYQGIVEIVLRGVLIALAFFTFIPGAVLLSHLKFNTDGVEDITNAMAVTRTGAQWIIFLCWAVIISQVVSIVLRFINLTVVENYIGLVLIVGIIIRVLFIISWFCGAILFAVRSSDWLHLKNKYDSDTKVLESVPFSTILSSAAGTSSFCFFALFGDIALTVWMVMWLVLRWQQQVTQQIRYQPGPTSADRDAEDWAPEED